LAANDFMEEDEELDLEDEEVADCVLVMVSEEKPSMLVMVSEVEPSVLVMAPEEED